MSTIDGVMESACFLFATVFVLAIPASLAAMATHEDLLFQMTIIAGMIGFAFLLGYGLIRAGRLSNQHPECFYYEERDFTN